MSPLEVSSNLILSVILISAASSRHKIKKSLGAEAEREFRGCGLLHRGRNLLAPSGERASDPGQGWGDTPRGQWHWAQSCVGHKKLEGDCTDGW